MNHLIVARSKQSLTCREIVMHCWQILQRVPRGDVPCVVQFVRYLGAIDQLKEDAGELKVSCPLFLATKMWTYPKLQQKVITKEDGNLVSSFVFLVFSMFLSDNAISYLKPSSKKNDPVWDHMFFCCSSVFQILAGRKDCG